MTSPSFDTTSCGIIHQRRGFDSDDFADSIASAHPVCFFFQAEDGIRDVAVTGVQTCALPIYRAIEHPFKLEVFFRTEMRTLRRSSNLKGCSIARWEPILVEGRMQLRLLLNVARADRKSVV